MSLPTHSAPSQAIRCGDRNRKASIARQRKNATATPRQQVKAIAAIVRKRLADGQPVPDLDRYRLDDATWAELLDILSLDELSAVGAENFDDRDDEPSVADVTIAFGDMPLMPEPPAPQQTSHVAHGWRDQNPVYTHSLKWRDGDDIAHLHIIRSDDLDELLRQVKTIKIVIAAAKARDAKAGDAAQTPKPDSRPDWCQIHAVQMRERSNARGMWFSHPLDSGGFCKGK